jgi:muramidase (phage lysozyme)
MKSVVDFIGGATRAVELFFALWLGSKFLAVLKNIGSLGGSMGGLGKAAMALAAAGATDQALRAVDPTDKFGTWIDHYVPGASALDNLASHFGAGRSYADQKQAEKAAGYGAPSHPTADTTMDPTKRAFLDTLAGPESGGAYNIKNGGAKFSDYSQFPEGVGAGGSSTAAGRYQITSGTWGGLQKQLGLKDFSPANQDKAAWHLAATRYHAKTGGDLEADLKAGGHERQITSALGAVWPSLPGGSQSHQSLAEFSRALKRNTADDTLPGSDVARKTTPPGSDVLAGSARRPDRVATNNSAETHRHDQRAYAGDGRKGHLAQSGRADAAL